MYPSGGIILRTTTVGFNKGETVFDVLNRICKERGIQIEYSYSPMYGSSYVEGINNLYEFDCGNQSGGCIRSTAGSLITDVRHISSKTEIQSCGPSHVTASEQILAASMG